MQTQIAEPSARTPLEAALRRARYAIIIAGVFSGMISLLMLVAPLYMMQVYDRVLTSGSQETLYWLTALVGFAFLIMAFLEIARTRILARIGMWIEHIVGEPTIAAILERKTTGPSPGGQPLRDLATIRSFFSGGALNALFDLPFTPIFILILWALHPVLGLIAVISAAVLFAIAVLNERLTRDPIKNSERYSVASQVYVEATSRNADVIRSMGLFPGVISRWREASNRALGAAQSASDISSGISGASRALRLFVQSLILGAGAFLAIDGAVSFGTIIAASILLGRALAPIDQSINVWKGVLSARESYRRLNALLSSVPPKQESQPLPPPQGYVTIEDVSHFASGAPSADEAPLLKRVSFEARPGEILGVVGPSGAGKSTLCQILVGAIRPTAGAVRMDGADLNFWSENDLGQYIGYLPQNVELLHGTVRDNIARMTDSGPVPVLEAARLADVHDMVLRLPDGYDTQVGEGGARLSGGQRQRIGLARAIFGGPKLVVLDEPNSNLDHAGETALMDALEQMKARGAAVIVVAHRANVLARADRLLVLRDGQVAAFGPRSEILSRLYGPQIVSGDAENDRLEEPAAAAEGGGYEPRSAARAKRREQRRLSAVRGGAA